MNNPLQRLAEEMLCGGDPSCRSELEGLTRLVEDLDKAAHSLPPPFLEESGAGRPLALLTRNLAEIKSEARRLAGDEAASDYLARRRLYLSLRGHVRPESGASRCPICGYTPRLIVMKRVDQGIFSGHEPRARCTCGMEWPVEEWRCPSCGARGRESFTVYIIRQGLLEARICKVCGHRLGVTWARPRQAEVVLANLLLDSLGAD